MKIINIHKEKIISQMKPEHGVGQPPMMGIDCKMFQYLADARIPCSRLHDVGGRFGGNLFVDIPNIFRDFDADEYDTASYDFAFTDKLIVELKNYNIEPFFRLGVTIENFHYIKAYRIYPPEDMEKWARICVQIIKHYNEGWANGFNFGIKYWEIWNEPENGYPEKNNQMWKGTDKEYFKLYEISSKLIKEECPDVFIGGYGGCGFYGLEPQKYKGEELGTQMYRMRFFDDFLDYVKTNNCPLDYFSWHSYESVDITVKFARYVRQKLDENGFNKTASIMDEWNCNSPWNTEHDRVELFSAKAAADVCEMLIRMQDESVDMSCYYDARCGTSMFSGMFNPLTRKPFKTYYAFKAFNELYKLKNQVLVEMDSCNGLYAIAASNNGCTKMIITNSSQNEIFIKLNAEVKSIILTDEKNSYENIEVQIDKTVTVPREAFLLVEIN